MGCAGLEPPEVGDWVPVCPQDRPRLQGAGPGLASPRVRAGVGSWPGPGGERGGSQDRRGGGRCNIALYSIRPCFYHQSHPQLGIVFAWLHPFILSGVISPLISSSILGTY